MSIQVIVDRRWKKRVGRGFSKGELREAGLGFYEALKLGIPIDTRRSTKHQENVKNLRAYLISLKPKPAAKEKKKTVIELTEVKGIGPKMAEKLKEARIKTAKKLASSSPERIMKATGISKKKALSITGNAKALMKESQVGNPNS